VSRPDDEVAGYRKTVAITKWQAGRRARPASGKKAQRRGILKGELIIKVNIISPLDVEWEALKVNRCSIPMS